MATNAIRAGSGDACASLRAIMNDLAAFQRDFAAHAVHIRNGGLGGRADGSARPLGKQIKDQPLMSLFVNFDLRFIGSRFPAL